MAAGDEKRVDLVFQGGGVKGIALVGAYSVLEENGYQAQNVAGASAGAIVASLVAAGYRANELFDVLSATPFSSFMDANWAEKLKFVGALGKIASILHSHGIYRGEAVHEWLAERLEAKGITTFGQLRVEGETEPRYMYKLQVVVSDVTHHSMLLLPAQADAIGTDPDELLIADAVRMSMSIPLFFEPVVRDGPDGEVVLVDGGMLSNFPVWIFDSEGVPEWPTFGLKLVDPNPSGRPNGVSAPPAPLEHEDSDVRKLVGYLQGLVATMTDAHDKLYLERADFVRTITISNCGVRTTDFNLGKDRIEELYASGQDAAQTFLKTWDFAAYKEAFRTGKEQPTRREATARTTAELAAKP